jgi:hypothetical protein
MSLPPDIRKQHQGTVKQITLLRSMHPHPQDISLRGEHSTDLQSSAASDIDTTGTDAAMILLRSMISRGFEIESPSSYEKQLIDLAWADIGWNEDEDRVWGSKVIKLLNYDKGPEDTIATLTFESILLRSTKVGFRHLQLGSEAFKVLEPIAFFRDEGAEEWTMDLSEQETPLNWSGTWSLNDRMAQLFTFEKEGKEWVVVGKRPAFVGILLNNMKAYKQDRVTFQLMRTFHLRSLILSDQQCSAGPVTVNTLPKLSSQDVDYNLFAVVRLANDHEKDDIRLYNKDFTETIPAEVGRYEEKEANIKSGCPRWSVEDGGRYLLVYYRVSQPSDWPFFMPTLGPTLEYEGRPWYEAPAATSVPEPQPPGPSR